jgi:hypothetical protein
MAISIKKEAEIDVRKRLQISMELLYCTVHFSYQEMNVRLFLHCLGLLIPISSSLVRFEELELHFPRNADMLLLYTWEPFGIM